jgi:hypothetical protein
MYVLLQNNFEQIYAIKFRVKLEEGVNDTYEEVQKAFGKDSPPRSQILRWHKDFVRGRETVDDEQRSGRPAAVKTNTNVDFVGAFISQDRHLTIRMIAHEFDINECTVHQIVTQNLNMRKMCAKMVPKKFECRS